MGGVEPKLMGRFMEGESLATEPFLLSFHRTRYAVWLLGTGFVLRFHNRSEFSPSTTYLKAPWLDLGLSTKLDHSQAVCC